MTERPAQAVPTLTEVIDWPAVAEMPVSPVPPHRDEAQPSGPVPTSAASSMPDDSAPAEPVPAPLTDEEIVDGVLATVQAAFVEADGALDQRLRDVLEPALARFADALVASIRADFAAALRDVAAAAVAQELGRYRRG